MKKTYNYFYELLEELRIESKMTVADLCHDIISERTYYRYLKSEIPATFTNYSKLLNRLGVDLGQLVINAMHFKKADAGTIKFLYRSICDVHLDTMTHYQRVSEASQLQTLEDIAMQAHLKRFEFNRHMISKENYQISLNQYLDSIKNENAHSIYTLTIHILQAELHGKSTDEVWAHLMDDIVNIDYKFSPMMYMASIIILLDGVIKYSTIDGDRYRKTVTYMNELMHYFSNKPFLMKHNLHLAYLNYLDKNEEDFKEHLYLYVMFVINLKQGETLKAELDQIEHLLHIDVHAFIKEMSMKRLMMI